MLLHYTDWNIGEGCDDSISNHEKHQAFHHLSHLLLPCFSLFTNDRGNVTLLKDEVEEELLLIKAQRIVVMHLGIYSDP